MQRSGTALFRGFLKSRNRLAGSLRYCSVLEKETERQKKEAAAAQRRNELILKNARSAEDGSRGGQSFEDITEFFDRNMDQLKVVKQTIEDGKEPNTTIPQYAVMFGKWMVKKGKNTKEWVSLSSEERRQRRAAKKEQQTQNRAAADESMAGFYQTQELINLMKFKGVTFDNGKEPGVPAADFESFSRRICDNYDVFKKTEAYSNLEFRVVKDPSKSESKFEDSVRTNYRDIGDGALTGWLTEATEVEEKKEAEEARTEPGVVRPPPYSVDYVTGEVTVLDTCSPEEFLDFLEREAPRAELRQIALHEEQVKMHEQIAELVEKIGLETIVYNGGKSSLTDKEYKKLKEEGKEGQYVMPADVMKALEEINKAPRLYQKYLKGHTLRLLPTAPARAYFIDSNEKEVCVPKDFFKDTFLPVHNKYRRYQKVEVSVRKLRFVGWVLLITLLGDVEWPAMWPLV